MKEKPKQKEMSTHGIRIKTFIGWSDKNLDKKVNRFLRETPMTFIDMKFSSTVLFYTAAILYKKPEDEKPAS